MPTAQPNRINTKQTLRACAKAKATFQDTILIYFVLFFQLLLLMKWGEPEHKQHKHALESR
jgi:hypothetical protein